MSKEGNSYGIPVPAGLDAIDPQLSLTRARVLPRQAPLAAPCDILDELSDELADELTGELEEGETWRDEMSAAERASYDTVQAAVGRAVCAIAGAITVADQEWITEETLYQIQRLVRAGERVTLPGLGIIYLDPTGALAACGRPEPRL